MSRSPLSYPLTRTADTDIGGAADLQTDVMRFMAILSLCLVAIFALVQSIPLTPTEPQPEPVGASLLANEPDAEPVGASLLANEPDAEPAGASLLANEPDAEPVGASLLANEAEQPVVLTRPKWVPKHPRAEDERVASELAPAIDEPVATTPAPAEPEQEGFTLRFASDAALTRAVAAHHVGVYAIAAGKAKRMTVAESRISFWDASTPNTFHEMESRTVPAPVVDALARTGIATGAVAWGVTLPGKMTAQVDSLMQQHRGGSLIIEASGDIHWEAPQ
jgi:hypothetical protein